MKILHTADWHIGKKLHKTELAQDFDLYINWLCKLIKEEQVELLLVSGDIFDLANPSSEARAQYYRSLIKLKKLNCKIIMTGGNHDSPAMLEAPKEILQELDIHIIGGLPQNLEELIIPVPGTSGRTEVVIAAVPFLRDANLRSLTEGSSYDDRLEATRNGIREIFHNAAALCRTHYRDVPAIALGHLFAAGMESSESEREIQIGNQAAFDASHFGDYYQYIALGHIHKPQQVSAAVPAYYSGSPLSLSFSERKDQKRMLLLDTTTGFEPESIPIPAFRKLLKLSGSLDLLREKLNLLDGVTELENLIEIELIEEQFDAVKIYELDELVTAFDKPGYQIVKHRATFKNRQKSTSESFEPHQQLEDLKPKDVFLELIADHQYEDETQQELVSAFDELLQDLSTH
jgi:DNA repair protein SbcD/Mre11